HAAVADGKNLQGGARSFHVRPENISFLELGGRDFLRVSESFQTADLVPQGARFLVTFLECRLLHLLAQPRKNLVGLSLEEESGVLTRLPVALDGTDLGHTGREAALNLILKARARAAPIQLFAAGTNAEGPVNDGRRPSSKARGYVGPSVGVLVIPDPPHDMKPRVLFGQGELQIGVVLVITEKDIEAGAMSLDEVVLESQCLHLAVRDNEIKIGNFLDHRPFSRIDGPVRLKIGPDPVPQDASFADIENLSLAVLEEIHPRPDRQ